MKKKLFAVIKAAILGAVIAEAITVAIGVAYLRWSKGQPAGELKEYLYGLMMLTTIPAAVFSDEKAGLANGWVVNGVLGAIAFGLAALFWQFVGKSNDNEDRPR